MSTKTTDFTGIWIPAEIWNLENLSFIERLFFAQIHALDNEGGCTSNNEYFSKFFGLSKVRVSEIINKLVKEKLVTSQIEVCEGNKRKLNTLLKKSLRGYKDKPLEGIKEKPIHIYKEESKEESKEEIKDEIKEESEFSKNENFTPSQDEIIISDISKKEKKEKAPQAGGAVEKKVWGEWKDGQGDGELHELLKDYFLNPNSPRYEAVEYQKFKAYWTAKVLSGRQKGKELWRTKETFSIAGRLSTWNQNKQNGSTSTGGKYQKVIPLTPTGIEPQNGRKFGKL